MNNIDIYSNVPSKYISLVKTAMSLQRTFLLYKVSRSTFGQTFRRPIRPGLNVCCFRRAWLTCSQGAIDLLHVGAVSRIIRRQREHIISKMQGTRSEEKGSDTGLHSLQWMMLSGELLDFIVTYVSFRAAVPTFDALPFTRHCTSTSTSFLEIPVSWCSRSKYSVDVAVWCSRLQQTVEEACLHPNRFQTAAFSVRMNRFQTAAFSVRMNRFQTAAFSVRVTDGYE